MWVLRPAGRPESTVGLQLKRLEWQVGFAPFQRIAATTLRFAAETGLPRLPTVVMVMRQRGVGEATPAMSGLSDDLIATRDAALEAAS